MFLKSLPVFLYVNLFLTNITFPLLDRKVNYLLNDCFSTVNKDLSTDILLKIEQEEVVYTVRFKLDGTENNFISYTYSYHRSNPEEIEFCFIDARDRQHKKNKSLESISAPMFVKENSTVKLVKNMGENFDTILKNLQPITYSNIKLDLILNKNSEDLISGYVKNTNDEANIPSFKIQEALENNLVKNQPNSLEKLAFNLYIYTLAISLVQHENLKLKPN